MQSDAEADVSSLDRRELTNLTDLLRDLAWWFAPGQVDVDLARRDVVPRVRRASDVDRRVGALHRWIENLGAAYRNMSTFEVNGFAAQNAFENLQELGGRHVALVASQVDAIALGLGRIASGDHVEQDAPPGDAVE